MLTPFTSAIRYNVPLFNKLSGTIERILVEPDCMNLFASNCPVIIVCSLTFMANASIVNQIAQKNANPQAQGYNILGAVLIGGDLPEVGE